MKTFTAPLLALLFGALSLISTAPNRMGSASDQARFDLPFFAERVTIDYDVTLTVDDPGEVTARNIDRAYAEVRRQPTHSLLTSLLAAKRQYALNDFLFYKLARKSVAVIYEGRNRNAQELTMYGLLIDAGYDARLTYRGQEIFVNVYTNEELFEVPIIDVRGRPYANLSCIDGQCDGRQRLFIHGAQPNPTGKNFSFQLRSWPKLTAQPKDLNLSFNYQGTLQSLDVTFDQTMVEIMKDYPFIHEYCYMETPLSPTLRRSLLPQLREMIAPLNEKQSLELLASFTRSAFNYKEDNENFGRSKPMVPEELFGYAYSDCEDRSALFYALVRELMDIPMAVIAYDDHLTIAVGTETVPGDEFTYDDRRYVFVDPTGPKDSSKIGRIPPGYENKRFKIIGRYK